MWGTVILCAVERHLPGFCWQKVHFEGEKYMRDTWPSSTCCTVADPSALLGVGVFVCVVGGGGDFSYWTGAPNTRNACLPVAVYWLSPRQSDNGNPSHILEIRPSSATEWGLALRIHIHATLKHKSLQRSDFGWDMAVPSSTLLWVGMSIMISFQAGVAP